MIRFLLTLVWVVTLAEQQENRGQSAENPLRQLFYALDSDDDGVVSCDDAALMFGVKPGQVEVDPRSLRTIELMDANNDGLITGHEFEHGYMEMIEARVAGVMECDVDKNGSLTLREYALSNPDAYGEMQDNGYTDRQMKAFTDIDKDGDGLATRDEVDKQQKMYRLTYLPILEIVYHMFSADANDDSKLNLGEFTTFLRGTSIDAGDIEARFDAFGPVDGLLDYNTVRLALYRTDDKSKAREYVILGRAYTANSRMLRLIDCLTGVSDRDGDGQVSFKEYAVLNGVDKLEGRDLQFIRQFDPNSDQKVTADEIESMLLASIAQGVAATMATDVDADGKLTSKEFSLAVPNARGEGDGESNLQQERFTAADADGDGSVSRIELLLQRTEAINMSLMARLAMVRAFAKLDVDENNELDQEEFDRGFSSATSLTFDAVRSIKLDYGSSTATSGISRKQFERALMLQDRWHLTGVVSKL